MMRSITFLVVAFGLLQSGVSRAQNPACAPECQIFDHINNVCRYTSTCETQSDGTVIRTVCDRFDPIDQVCRAEGRVLHSPAGVVCVESCQQFDGYNQVCKYETSCRFEGACALTTYCKSYDFLNQVCLEEAVANSCSARPY